MKRVWTRVSFSVIALLLMVLLGMWIMNSPWWSGLTKLQLVPVYAAFITVAGVIMAPLVNSFGLWLIEERRRDHEAQTATERDFIHFGDTIAIKTCEGTYVMADREDIDEDRAKLKGVAPSVRGWELFVIVDPQDLYATRRIKYGDYIALRAGINGLYVGADTNANVGGTLIAAARKLAPWEKFRFLPCHRFLWLIRAKHVR